MELCRFTVEKTCNLITVVLMKTDTLGRVIQRGPSRRDAHFNGELRASEIIKFSDNAIDAEFRNIHLGTLAGRQSFADWLHKTNA